MKEFCIYKAGRIIDIHMEAEQDTTPEEALAHWGFVQMENTTGMTAKAFPYLTPNLPESERGF